MAPILPQSALAALSICTKVPMFFVSSADSGKKLFLTPYVKSAPPVHDLSLDVACRDVQHSPPNLLHREDLQAVLDELFNLCFGERADGMLEHLDVGASDKCPPHRDGDSKAKK